MDVLSLRGYRPRAVREILHYSNVMHGRTNDIHLLCSNLSQGVNDPESIDILLSKSYMFVHEGYEVW